MITESTLLVLTDMRVLCAIALSQFAGEKTLGVRSLLRKRSCEKTGKIRRARRFRLR
jgi:hypothetical protein